MNSFYDTFNFYIIPFLEAAALCMVIVFLYFLIKLLKDASFTINKTHKTIDLIDTSIEKIQSPLDTAEKVSKTINKAYDATANAVSSAKAFLKNNVNNIKNKITSNDEDEYDDEEE